MMQKGRIEYIDIFRGIGIMLMILGHIGMGEKYDFIIHAFNMPMFFVISGYFYRKRTIFERVTKHIRTLIIPYFITGIGYYLFWCVANQVMPQGRHLFALISGMGGGMPITGAIQWFLTALFLTDLVYSIADKYISNHSLLLIILICFSGIGITHSWYLFPSPWAFMPACAALIFYHFGRCIHEVKKKKFIEKIQIRYLEKSWQRKILFIVLFVGNIVLIHMNGYVNMRTSEYSNWILFYINGILASLLLLKLSKTLELTLRNNEQNIMIKSLGTVLKCMGRDSVVFLCLNQIVILIISRICSIKILNIILVFIILYLADIVVMKTKLKIIFGK